MTASEKSIYPGPVFSGLKVARVCPLSSKPSVILCLNDNSNEASIGLGLRSFCFDDPDVSRAFFAAALNLLSRPTENKTGLVGYAFNLRTGEHSALKGSEALSTGTSSIAQPHDLDLRYWLFGSDEYEDCTPGFSFFKGVASCYSEAEYKTSMFHSVQIVDRHTGMEYVRVGSSFLRKVLGDYPSPFHLLTRKA